MDGTISHLIVQIAKLHRARVGAALGELGMHIGQDLLLAQLWREEGLTQSELVARLGVEPPTVTRALQRMERTGLIERHPDPDDARVSRVFPTEHGRGLREPVERIWREAEERATAGFSAEERILLRRLLIGVRDNLD